MAAGDTTITVIGNLTADPELRFTPSGAAVANFTVASTPRTFDRQTNEWKDGEALFLRCNIWREAAENVAESLTRGARVIVTGRLKQRSFETREGDKARRRIARKPATVRRVEHLGDQTRLHLTLGAHEIITLADPHTPLAPGDSLSIRPENPLWFDASGSRI